MAMVDKSMRKEIKKALDALAKLRRKNAFENNVFHMTGDPALKNYAEEYENIDRAYKSLSRLLAILDDQEKS